MPFTVFACSFLVSGQLLNLELNFAERPLPSELRARVVNAFRAEEASIIDRSQSLGFDVAVMFVFDTRVQRWRTLQPGDLIDGAQVYAQARMSTSIVRSICDTTDAVEFAKIPPPRKEFRQRPVSQGGGLASPPPSAGLRRAASPTSGGGGKPQSPFVSPRSKTSPLRAKSEGATMMILSSDDDDDHLSPASIRFGDDDDDHDDDDDGGDLYGAGADAQPDLALAECWDEAVRTLFRALDDDNDGLVNISDIPATLQRVSAGAGIAAAAASHVDLFPAVRTAQRYQQQQQQQQQQQSFEMDDDLSLMLVDEPSFVAFCNKPENAGAVSGLLAFVHNCKHRQQQHLATPHAAAVAGMNKSFPSIAASPVSGGATSGGRRF